MVSSYHFPMLAPFGGPGALGGRRKRHLDRVSPLRSNNTYDIDAALITSSGLPIAASHPFRSSGCTMISVRGETAIFLRTAWVAVEVRFCAGSGRLRHIRPDPVCGNCPCRGMIVGKISLYVVAEANNVCTGGRTVFNLAHVLPDYFPQ